MGSHLQQAPHTESNRLTARVQKMIMATCKIDADRARGACDKNVCATHPNVCATHPTVCATHPTVCATHPTVCATHPTVCATHPTVCATHPLSYSRNGMSIFVLLLYSGYALGKVATRFRSSTIPQ